MILDDIGQDLTFGPFRLDRQQRVIFRAHAPLRLGSRAREILLILVERAGEVVKKSELMARVWPDTIVEEGTLRVHIAALRKALGDGQSGVRYVENVTGHGYRFIAPLTRVDETRASPATQVHAADAHNVPIALMRMIGRATVVAALARHVFGRRAASTCRSENSHRIEDVRAALDWCFSPEGDPVLDMNLTAASDLKYSLVVVQIVEANIAVSALESVGVTTDIHCRETANAQAAQPTGEGVLIRIHQVVPPTKRA
jgi:DNA-binding winged helix-turn-helix (wHTH) protein